MATQDNSTQKTVTQCPYCGDKVSKQTVRIFFNEEDLPDTRYAQSRNKSLLDSIFMKHNRSDAPYINFWEGTYRLEGVEAANGVVIDIGILEKSMKEVDITPTSKNGKIVYETHDSAGNVEYTFTLDKENPANSSIHERGLAPVHPRATLCPHCENFYPLGLFDKKIVNIMLAGSTSVGKSAYLMSLLQGASYPNLVGKVNGDEKWEITSAIDAIDPFHRKFNEDILNLSNYGVLPAGTDRPLPPLFYHLKTGANKEIILCLIDTMGERWNTPGLVNYFNGSCDGIIYMIEPNQGKNYTGSDPINTPAQFAPGYNPDPKVMPPTTKAMYANATQNGPKQASDPPEKIYMDHFRTNNQKNHIPCAFVLTKVDRYMSGGKFGQSVRTDEIPFWDRLVNSQSAAARTSLYDFREAAFHNLAAFKLIEKHFSNMPTGNSTFSRTNWFAVSAFKGDSFKGRWKDNNHTNQGVVTDPNGPLDLIALNQLSDAINIHEPLIWLLTEILYQS